jgi:hypothetical protein
VNPASRIRSQVTRIGYSQCWIQRSSMVREQLNFDIRAKSLLPQSA